MGQARSKKELKNIRPEEIETFMLKFKEGAGGKEKISREQFCRTYPIFCEFGNQFYLRLMSKEQGMTIQGKSFLKIIDRGLGHLDDLAAALLDGFGDSKEQIMRNTVKMYCEANAFTREDQVRLYDYFEAQNTWETNQLESFFSACPLFPHMAYFIFNRLIGRPGDSKMPTLNEKSIILSKVDQLVINSHLPFDRRKEWSLLFSNAVHGNSFLQMVRYINGEGPVIVVIRSTRGRRFGFFADHGVVAGPQYIGTSQCFLFQCAPKMAVYNSTERTEKYVYLNFQQKQLPNGLGISGQDDVWPIFIREEFDKGVCQKNASSYEPCFVAEETEFSIKFVEVWRVGDKPQNTFDEAMGSANLKEKSIIDKDPEVKAVLELAGRPMHSTAYREPAPLLADES
uniref:MTOR-associated protein MEAK7 n=1 Tax=Caenorhabditis japonica TaxID=281687 RepID=A0A8R1DXH0_CAEJA